MKIVRGASKVSAVRKRISIFVVLIFGIVGLGLTPAIAVDQRVVDIVSVTWTGAVPLYATVNEIADAVNTEVNSDWRKFTTMYGDTKDRTISFVSGALLQAPITLLAKMPCEGAAASDFITSVRTEAYKRLGISDSSKRYLIIAAPKAGCVWSGRAPMGKPTSVSGALILHDTGSGFVIAHELGHTFGLGHSNFLRCDNSANDGAWSDSCKAVEYGGSIDVMGNVDTTSPLNTYHQWRMGLIDDSQIKQVWQSEVVNLAPSDFANGIKAIYVRDGSAAYWIEYRRKTDGASYKPGLAIYRIDPPPVTSIVSPNPEDMAASNFSTVLSTDVWMLNLDTYVYKDSRIVGGSMTGLTGTTYSGNVSFSAVATETGAVVTIKKKPVSVTTPVPPVIPVEQWNSPNMTILQSGYDGPDAAIVGFEAQINGTVQSIKASDIDGWLPTYLNPFIPPKTVYLRDLPEGSYSFSLRAIDVLGNKSAWTKPMNVVVDRAHPVVTNDFVLAGVNGNELSYTWKGATDAGSGVCQVNIVDEDGLMIQNSTVKNAPVIKVNSGSSVTGTAQVFDCLGNGITGNVSVSSAIILPTKGTRTGIWNAAPASYGSGAIKCVGKCTISLTTSGKNDVLVGSGGATVAIANKTVATIADSKVAKLRVGASIDAGTTKKVVRISGSNFVLIGLSSFTSTLGPLTELDRLPAVPDTSLTDVKQATLAKLGFRASDFGQEWTLQPMSGGTTLDDPTLDLCNATFASEKDRLERRQTVATKKGSPFAFLSSEVVRYSSPAAAQSAQQELVKVMAQCKIDKGYKDATGALVPYTFAEIKNIPAGLVGDSSRVLVRATIDSGLNSRQLLGFYQFNGATFTGLYVMKATDVAFTDAEVAKWLQVAATMANRLKG